MLCEILHLMCTWETIYAINTWQRLMIWILAKDDEFKAGEGYKKVYGDGAVLGSTLEWCNNVLLLATEEEFCVKEKVTQELDVKETYEQESASKRNWLLCTCNPSVSSVPPPLQVIISNIVGTHDLVTATTTFHPSLAFSNTFLHLANNFSVTVHFTHNSSTSPFFSCWEQNDLSLITPEDYCITLEWCPTPKMMSQVDIKCNFCFLKSALNSCFLPLFHVL